MRYLHKVIYMIAVTSVIVLNAQNNNSIQIKKATVEIGQNDLVFSVSGLVCSFCSFGLQKGLSKLDWIDKSKHDKGVFADINNQYVMVGIKPNLDKNINDAISIIKSSGYEVYDYYINPEGEGIERHKIKEAPNEK